MAITAFVDDISAIARIELLEPAVVALLAAQAAIGNEPNLSKCYFFSMTENPIMQADRGRGNEARD